ncbi:MAG: hypothetical protein R6W82_03165, partial [bacterium]
FAVLADTTRPVLLLRSPRDGSTVRSRRPLIEFEVNDEASGFSSDTRFTLRLDGSRVIAEYDPQRSMLRFTPREDLDPGDHWITVEAVDEAGNRGRLETRFRVR